MLQERRLEPLDQRSDATQMRFVRAVDRAKRQTDRVNGKLIVPPQPLDGQHRWRPRQIVLGMNLEKAGCRRVARDLRQMR